jgi:hypothetical protein
MLEVTLTTEGGEQVLAKLESLDANTANLLPAFRDITQQILAEEYMIFEGEGAYRGRPAWPELSEEYAARKAKATRDGVTVGGDLGILELSGRLLRSLTDMQDPNHFGEIRPDGMTFGSKRLVEHKGKAYNLGYLHHTAAGNLPVRQALTVVDEQVEEWGRLILAHIDGADHG